MVKFAAMNPKELLEATEKAVRYLGFFVLIFYMHM